MTPELETARSPCQAVRTSGSLQGASRRPGTFPGGVLTRADDLWRRRCLPRRKGRLECSASRSIICPTVFARRLRAVRRGNAPWRSAGGARSGAKSVRGKLTGRLAALLGPAEVGSHDAMGLFLPTETVLTAGAAAFESRALSGRAALEAEIRDLRTRLTNLGGCKPRQVWPDRSKGWPKGPCAGLRARAALIEAPRRRANGLKPWRSPGRYGSLRCRERRGPSPRTKAWSIWRSMMGSAQATSPQPFPCWRGHHETVMSAGRVRP